MTWWNDQLHVCGRFDRIGDVQGGKLARWDGNEWCMLTYPNYMGNGNLGALTVYHDSLYIGGAFLEAGGYEVSCFGKWIGGEETYACGALTGVGTLEPTHGGLTISPNPVSGSFAVQGLSSRSAVLVIRDILGRDVLRITTPTDAIDVGYLSGGTYTVTAFNPTGLPLGTARFVKE